MELFDALNQWEAYYFLLLNGKHNLFWDFVMSAFTRKEVWLPLYITIAFVIIRRYGIKGIVILLTLTLTLFLCDQLSNIVKDITERYRPTHDPALKNLVHNVMRKGGRYGFFSAHAANVFSVVAFTGALFKRKGYTFIVVLWALVVSYSRVYLGVHYPTDVLAGILIGLFIGWLVYRITLAIDTYLMRLHRPLLRKTRIEKQDVVHIVLVLLTSIAVIMIAVMKFKHYNMISSLV